MNQKKIKQDDNFFTVLLSIMLPDRDHHINSFNIRFHPIPIDYIWGMVTEWSRDGNEYRTNVGRIFDEFRTPWSRYGHSGIT